jgi:hypothetical protein
MKIMNKYILMFGVVGALLAGNASATSVSAFSFTGGSSGNLGADNPGVTIGYSFSVNAGQAINITDLGYFDSNLDGFDFSHEIGVWDSVGTLLTSTTLSVGSGSTLIDGFRYDAISSLYLSAGDYVIGGLVEGESYIQGAALVNNSPTELTYGGSLLDFSVLLKVPGIDFDDDAGYFGPNFQMEVAAVPIPAAAWLFGSALLGLGAIKRKRA